MDFKNKRVLVMGLGLHGGGVETARWLVGHGAKVVCTDLQDEKSLSSSVEALNGLGIRFVLGRHDKKEFDDADIIVKNPAVPSTSPLLAGRNNIETDISIFLACTQANTIAVTGSKGKSTVVSALHSILGGRLGGNITVSPLSFISDLMPGETVILELSSWQLADLKGRALLRPSVSCITNLMWDHQNRYNSFADYESDKRVIYENSGPDDWCVFPDDEHGHLWASNSNGRLLLVGANGRPDHPADAVAWLDADGRGWMEWGKEKRVSGNVLGHSGLYGEVQTAKKHTVSVDAGQFIEQIEEILPLESTVPGLPFRLNSLFAAAMARLQGCPAQDIRTALAKFNGIPYRMEFFLEHNGVRFYDDTAATMPDAAAAAVRAFQRPVILVAGGTDKELDFMPFDSVAGIPKRLLMLEGTATDRWLPRLEKLSAATEGPFTSMKSAVQRAWSLAEPGDVVLLSPGAASFSLFRHEFERGDAFKLICRGLAD